MQANLEKLGISKFELPRWFAWRAEISDIMDVLHAHHGDQLQYANVTPPRNWPRLREDLMTASPGLAALATLIAAKTESTGCGVVIPELGLGGFDLNTRMLMVYALGACLGHPSPTDQRQQRVIWDVRHKPVDPGVFVTFSEHNGEAAFHTDSQYFPSPENHFILYTAQAASCGGGISRVCDGRPLRARLARKAGLDVCDLLTERAVPFRIPSVFCSEGQSVEATFAPIFFGDDCIRYRYDTLSEGFRTFPEYADPDVVNAVLALNDLIENELPKADFVLPTDGFIYLDNHHALHARTGFTDLQRHLARIRFRTEKAVAQAAMGTVSTRSKSLLAV